jgi:hypothetical protein
MSFRHYKNFKVIYFYNLERNPEQIRKRQAEIKATADKAMGRLAILTAAAQIGDGDAGQIWPPLLPGDPPIIPRFQGTPRLQGTPLLQGTPRPTGIQPLGTPRIQLGLRQGTPLGRPLLLNAFVRQQGPQTARLAYPPATPRGIPAATTTTTATPMGLRAQQQPIIPGPGDALLQADGTSHIPPGLGLAQPAPPPPGYNPYSYVAPHLRATGTLNRHQTPLNPAAAGGASAYFRQQQQQQQQQQHHQQMFPNYGGGYAQPYGGFQGFDGGQVPYMGMATQGLWQQQGGGVRQPIRLPALPLPQQPAEVENARWYAGNCWPELAADCVPGLFSLSQYRDILTLRAPREGEEWMRLNPRHDEQRWVVLNS